ncbi:MAG: glycosyltransferase family 2 protein [Clostridia bacterium]|nr:glycosyltransferase family 2 protein [Clostridia bacterium]
MENSKLITFAVPCYNSENCMRDCIESLLTAKDYAEIIIINDGSADKTGEIADSYAEKYPGTVIAHHQENGGHGEGVNQGIRLASGKYYKVVDSDDRLDPDALKKAVDALLRLENDGNPVDMFVCNYVYVRIDTGERRPMKYSHIFPQGKISSWEESRPFGVSQYLMMHSVIYRTELLREHSIELPKHTFYEDNLYMYAPFPYVEKIFYLDLDLYLYYVGSDEQSVSEKNVLKRIDQQIRVAKLMIDSHDLNKIRKEKPRLYRCMLHELSIILSICDVFLSIQNTEESVEKIRDLWEYLKKKDPVAYKKLRYFSLAGFTKLPGRAGRRIIVAAYRAVHKIYKFN